jgi:nucleoside phosphorylase
VIDAESGDAISVAPVLRADGIPVGPLLTTPHPLQDAQSKQRARCQFSCDLVDMEGYSLAQLGQTLGKPVGIIRVLSDAADDSLPREITNCVDRAGNLKVVELLATVAIRPWLWPRLFTLWKNNRMASAGLARTTRLLIERFTNPR